jgi:hypothetical protein
VISTDDFQLSNQIVLFSHMHKIKYAGHQYQLRMGEDASQSGFAGREGEGTPSPHFPRARIAAQDGKVELKVVDLARRRAASLPPWLVRRGAQIVRENLAALDLEELADLAMVLMQEAEARLSTKGAQVTR